MSDRRNPIEIVRELVPSAGDAPMAIWAGKPSKKCRRYFVFIAAEGRTWLAKIAEGADPALENEYHALGRVGPLTDRTPLAFSVPREIRFADGVLVQEWIGGQAIRDGLLRLRHRPWRESAARQLAFAAVDWLSEFHRLADGGSWRGEGLVHGDFKPSNVLVRRGRPPAVIDWELFAENAAQVHDLFHFLMNFGLTCFAPDRTEGFVRSFLIETWVARIIRQAMVRYFRSVGAKTCDLVRAFDDYIDATLRRRAALGLSNDGHFLADIRNRLADARGGGFVLGVGA